MTEERNKNALDAFKLYISLYSAIVGGVIWLSTQAQGIKTLPSYRLLTSAVVLLVTLVAIILVIEAKRGWWGYRKALSKLVKEGSEGKLHVPPPKLFPTVLTEGAMVASMLLAGLAFLKFNPL